MDSPDLASFLSDLAQVVAIEREPDSLLEKFLQILMQHCKADRGLLLHQYQTGSMNDSSIVLRLHSCVGDIAACHSIVDGYSWHFPLSTSQVLLLTDNQCQQLFGLNQHYQITGFGFVVAECGVFCVLVQNDDCQPESRFETLIPALSLFANTYALCRDNQSYQQKLQQEKQKVSDNLQCFRTALDASRDAIFLIDSSTMHIVDFNQSMQKNLGYSRDELLTMSIYDLKPHVDKQDLQTFFETELVEKGEAVLVTVYRRKDASEYPVEMSFRYIEQQQGAPLINVVARDISDRVSIQQALLQNEKRLSGIIETAIDAIISIDEQQNIVLFNSAAEKIFAYRREELIGQKLDRLLPEKVRSNHQQLVQRFGSSTRDALHVPPQRLLQGMRKNGELFPLEANVSKLESDDGMLYTVILRDISERIANEKELQRYREDLEFQVQTRTQELVTARDEALRANRSKSDFLANMSHELRTPLNSIIGFTGLIKDGYVGDVNDEQVKQLSMVYDSAQHLLALINNILDLSKVEAGKMQAENEVFELEFLLAEIEDMMALQAQNKGLLFSTEISGAPDTIISDRVKLRQLLVNLVGNAIKFTDAGSVKLICYQDSEQLCIDVVDTGIGIPSDQLDVVFQSFRQIEQGDARQHQGTGLGLAICKQFVGLLSGEISVKSETGRGSTFTVRLPQNLISSQASQAFGGINVNHHVQNQGESNTILIIDDEPTALDLLSTYLKQQGYDTLLCQNSAEALNMAVEHQPFAITLDLVMPEPDGWTLLTQLKQIPETEHIPVIIVSILQEQQLGLSLGAVDYLVKPVEALQLASRVDKIRNRHSDILLIEDNQSDAELIAKILGIEGYCFRWVQDVQSGWRAINEKLPDMILLDLMLPGVSGLQLVQQLRSHEVYRDLPIIVISAKQLSAEERQFLRDNFVMLLAKASFTAIELLNEVGRLLHQVGLEQNNKEAEIME